jgi:hypothetical protein
MDGLNAWTRIVGSLSDLSAGCGQASRVTRKQRLSQGVGQSGSDGGSSVVALEVTGDYVLLVSWSDATRGRYAYQRWVIGTSRGAGCCALSGCRIRRGDQVYRPQWRGTDCPANGAEMILAATIRRMPLPHAEEETAE